MAQQVASTTFESSLESCSACVRSGGDHGARGEDPSQRGLERVVEVIISRSGSRARQPAWLFVRNSKPTSRLTRSAVAPKPAVKGASPTFASISAAGAGSNAISAQPAPSETSAPAAGEVLLVARSRQRGRRGDVEEVARPRPTSRRRASPSLAPQRRWKPRIAAFRGLRGAEVLEGQCDSESAEIPRDASIGGRGWEPVDRTVLHLLRSWPRRRLGSVRTLAHTRAMTRVDVHNDVGIAREENLVARRRKETPGSAFDTPDS